MCGRFGLGLQRPNIVRAVAQAYPDMALGDWRDEEDFHPRYNVAPRSRSPVLRRRNRFDDGPDGVQDSTVILQTMKWGLVPHWSKHEDKNLNTINAKAENLVESQAGMWNSIKGRKRCAVLCQGYYEWLKKGKERIPHFTRHKDGRIMLLAGLYDSVILEDEKETLWTFTIVTTDANKEFSWLHDRQPVILASQADLDIWLNTSSGSWSKELSNLVLPYSNTDAPLECYQVPKEVGKVGAESSTFIEPISQRKDGIEAMFAKQKKTAPSEQPEASSSSQQTRTPGSSKRKRLSPKLEEEDVEVLNSDEPNNKKARGASGSDIKKEEETPSRISTSRAKSKIKQESSDVQIVSPSSRKGQLMTPKKSTARTKTPSSTPSPSKITEYFRKDK